MIKRKLVGLSEDFLVKVFVDYLKLVYDHQDLHEIKGLQLLEVGDVLVVNLGPVQIGKSQRVNSFLSEKLND